jgi:Domain of unknown function (DUF6371)
MNYLQPYKGKSTRHTCPSCKINHSFTLYLSDKTHQPIHCTVGICNRENKCGYHYPPNQYFRHNPASCRDEVCLVSPVPRSNPITKTATHLHKIDYIPFSYVENSTSLHSNFLQFLTTILTPHQIQQAAENYILGATKSGAVIFWQIDTQGQVRTGKIMQYNPLTGKRIKHQSGAIDWVHNKLKKSGELPPDFNLQQCFFGEHLLTIYPDKPVAIVESEKSAIIASTILPDFIWLAAGNLNGLSTEKAKVLRGRNITFCPDLGAYDKWIIKAAEIKESLKCEIKVSILLEELATETQRLEGLDIADYIIEELLIIQK